MLDLTNFIIHDYKKVITVPCPCIPSAPPTKVSMPKSTHTKVSMVLKLACLSLYSYKYTKKSVCRSRSKLELDREQQTGSK